MPRASKVHYIAPSAVSITPNANGSPDDLAVYVARGSKIKVYSPKAGIDLVDASFQEWTMAGRNRRLGDRTKPYTIYARLSKQNKNDGYLVFAQKSERGGRWVDKYSCVTTEGLSVLYQDNGFDVVVADNNYWYIRLGDVSLPDSGKRTVTLDTGIVGTDQFNEEWNIDADAMSRRLSITQSLMGLIGRRDTQTVTFTVMYGWQDITTDYRFSVSRYSGDVAADAEWNAQHTNTGASWTMNYSDLNAATCSFTVTARSLADNTELTGDFIVRRSNDSLRYYLTVNTEIIRVDMNGDLTGSESGVRLVRSDVDNDGEDKILMLGDMFLASNTGQGRGNITAQAWRVSGADTIQKADVTDNLVIRATAFTGSLVEENDEVSETGYMSFLADRTCDKYVLELVDGNDGSIVYDTRTVAIVRDGSASIVADFDDEMGAGAAASDGTMLSGIPYTSVAHLYKGSSMLGLTDVRIINVNGTAVAGTASYQDQNITVGVTVVNNTDAVLTLSVLGKNAPDNNKFGVRLTGDGESAVAYFYFNKFKAGSDGHVTLFQLAPDTKAIKVNKQGQHSVQTVTVGVLRIDVDETGQTESNLGYAAFGNLGLSVYYKVDGAQGWTRYTQEGILVRNAATGVELKLEQTRDNSTILWDVETIPVVADGQDSNYVMRFSTYKHDIWKDPEDHSKGLADDWDTEFSPGTNWAIMSSDGGTSWNGPYPIVGEEGAPGDYTEFSFGISARDITSGSTSRPDDLPAPDEQATQYGWSDGIIAVTPDRPYLWMRSGLFKWDTTSTPPVHRLQGSYTYARVKGVDAADRYELEVSDTTWQIAQDGTTVTPGEITVKAVQVKANGDRLAVHSTAWIAANPKLTLSVVMRDDTTATKTYAASELTTGSFTGNALKVKDVLSRWGKSITGIKNVTVELTFYKGVDTVIGTATQTFNVLRNGRDGAIAVTADFDDEMISIPVQSDGSNAVWPAGGWTTTARLYRGTEQLALDDTHISAIQAPDANECGLVDFAGLTVDTNMTYAADKKSVSVTINGFSTNNDITNRKFVMQLTDATHQYTATCIGYVNKIPAGEGGDGKDAVIYQLALSQNVIHTDAGGNLTSSGSVTAYVYKYKGEDAPVIVTDRSIWIKIQSVGSDGYGDAILSQSGKLPSTGYVVFSAQTPCHNDKYIVSIYPVKDDAADTVRLLDQETIPVLRDGATPVITIVNGYWYVNGVSTGVSAEGSDGASVTLEFSQTGNSGWHGTFDVADKYARTVTVKDNTTTYGTPFRIVGEKGDPGNNGMYTDYQFARSADLTTDSPTTAPAVDTSIGDGGWSDGIPDVTSDYPYIWMKKTLMVYDSALEQYVPSPGGSSYYTRITGEKGQDGKDAEAYEFFRFSDNAMLVNGVWTGTFTGKSDAAIQAEKAEQGDTCNLLPNTDFAEWDTANQKPYGWSKNNGSESFSRANGWLSFNAPGGDNFYGLALSVETDDNGPMYLVPYDYNDTNRTRTISVRYYGSGQVMMGVHYYKWDESNKQLSFVNNYQEWQYAYGAEIADGEEHLLTFTFDIQEQNATHLRILLIHKAGTGESSKTYSYHFSQPKFEVGETATEYSIAPAWNPRLDGTVQGLWKGTLRWSHPYASTVFSDYSWSRVRDAEPRMTNWEDVTSAQRPTANNDDTTYERDHFLCGSYSERYYDMLYDGTDYWLCKKSYAYDLQIEVTVDGEKVKKDITPSEPALWSIYWERATQFNFLMAQTLVAQRALIHQLSVDKLHTTSSGAATIDISQGLINITGKTTAMKIGVDEDGEIILQYYKNNQLVVDLGLSGLRERTESIGNSWLERRYSYVDGGPNTSISTGIYAHTTSEVSYYQFSEGFVTQDGLEYKQYLVTVDLELQQRENMDEPSPFDGRWFNNDSTYSSYGGAPAGTGINGWYRLPAPKVAVESLERIGRTYEGTPIYKVDMWFFDNGEQTKYCEVYFRIGTSDEMIMCDLGGNTLDASKYPYIFSYYDSLQLPPKE